MMRTIGLSLCVIALLGSCDDKKYVHLYSASDHAPSIQTTDIQAMKTLGPTLVDQGVNFSVFSANASKMQLMLFDDPESDQPTKTFDLVRYGNVWNVYVQGVGKGEAYGFRAWGFNWTYDSTWYPGSIIGYVSDADVDGNRFNPNKLLFDPYSRAITRDHDWSKGTAASGPGRTDVDYAAAAKSVVSQSTYQWGAQEATYREGRKHPDMPGHGWNDVIIYEMHPKGFTASPASGVHHPGTFKGVAEKADYLKDLGVTAVQIMPVFEKPADGGYWGYETINFFTPENTYASATDPQDRIDEFKNMVEELHKRGIEVILDVVYNHTGEGGLWREKIQFGGASLDQTLDPRNFGNYDPRDIAGIYSYRGLDNASYYALSNTDKGRYNDSATGVGNASRANNDVWRQLILDSLHYWVSEMHVDGFRFDLAAELGETDPDIGCKVYDSDYNTWIQTTVLQQIVDDPVLQSTNTRVMAEPWGTNCFMLSKFPESTNYPGDGWYEHNGWFRDWWRAFINTNPVGGSCKADGSQQHIGWRIGDQNGSGTGTDFIYGTHSAFNDPNSTNIYQQRNPYNSVNFITIHDGFTMYDLVSYNSKQNGCSPLYPDCCQPITAYCNNDGEDNNNSHDWAMPSWVDELKCTSTAVTGVAADADGNDRCVLGCGGCGTCDATSSCSDISAKNWPGIDAPTDLQTCRDWYCGTNVNVSSAANSCMLNARSTSSGNAETVKRQLMRNFFTAMMMSHGTPMMLGGDEWMRTQLGNNNAWTTRADNEYNWYDWGVWTANDTNSRMHDFVKQSISLRKAHAYAVAPLTYDSGAPLEWHNATGGTLDLNSRALMVYYPKTAAGPALLWLINMEWGNTTFTLPAGNWKRLLNTDPAYEIVGSPIPGSDAAHVSGNVTLTNPAAVTDAASHVLHARVMEVLQAD